MKKTFDKRTVKTAPRIRLTSLVLLAAMLLSLTACGQAQETASQTTAGSAQGTTAAEKETSSTSLETSTAAEPATGEPGKSETEPQVRADDPETAQHAFTLGLFQKAAAEKKGENLLVAPLSMQLALAMTANGAKGDTLSELEAVLGCGASMEGVNQYLHGCLNSLQSKTDARFLIADSVWIRDDADRLHVEEDFIKSAQDWYDAQVFRETFDASTVDKLNGWVNEKTEGMIPKVKDDLSGQDMVLLVNAMTFDAEWQSPFALEQVHAGTFTTLDGREQSVQMMSAEHTSGYIKDEQAKGFLRPYRGGKYSFAALLPDEGVDLYDYIAGLTPERLHEVLSTRQQEEINLSFPKFSYSFDIDMIPLLQSMGVHKLFSKSGEADLTGLGTSSEGNLYISEAFQKTFISVDELGTKAGAVSMMIAVPESAIEISIVLNRPFVYMIVDNETSLPLFMGVVTEISE